MRSYQWKALQPSPRFTCDREYLNVVAGAELRLALSTHLMVGSPSKHIPLCAHQPAHSPQRKAACFTTRTPRVAVQSSSSLPVAEIKKPRAIHSGLLPYQASMQNLNIICGRVVWTSIWSAQFAFAPSIQRIYQAIIFLQAFSDKFYLCDKFCIFIQFQLLHSRVINLSLN